MRHNLSDGIYIAVYKDSSGVLQFASWGGWGKNQIRWYKTRKRGEKEIAEVLANPHRNPPPQNTMLAKFEIAENFSNGISLEMVER